MINKMKKNKILMKYITTNLAIEYEIEMIYRKKERKKIKTINAEHRK
jgi:hypothetical protein